MRIYLLFIITALSSQAMAGDKVRYPEDYRYWTHIKTLTLHAGHPLENPFKGIHHVYGNASAINGIKSNKFKDGSTLVFDLLENNTANKASSEGNRILIGVMMKDTKKYPDTGGWGFEAWKGNSKAARLTTDGGTSCFACHTTKKDHDFVFSQWRD